MECQFRLLKLDCYLVCPNICFCVCFYGASGQCVRELPVFGVVEGVYIKGVIDELSYNQKGELVLKELKTRKQDSLPGDSQAYGHRFQVCEIFSLPQAFFLLKLTCYAVNIINSNRVIVTLQENQQSDTE